MPSVADNLEEEEEGEAKSIRLTIIYRSDI